MAYLIQSHLALVILPYILQKSVRNNIFFSVEQKRNCIMMCAILHSLAPDVPGVVELRLELGDGVPHEGEVDGVTLAEAAEVDEVEVPVVGDGAVGRGGQLAADDVHQLGLLGAGDLEGKQKRKKKE